MSEYCGLTPEDFEVVDGERLARSLFFHPTVLAGHTVVGEATITMTLRDKDQLIDAKVDSLKASLNKEVADSYVRQNAIREKINQLLAITYKSEES
jgi:hypothetical protein